MVNITREIVNMDDMLAGASYIHRRHPLAVFLAVLIYIVSVLSVGIYNLQSLLLLVIFPIVMYRISGISLRTAFYKLRYILPILIFVGIWNPILDKRTAFCLGSFAVSYGILSFVTLLIKGCLSLLAAFLLMSTVGIEKLCYSLRLIKVPEMLVVLVLLTYRYAALIGNEARIMWDAYSMRSPGQKGIRYDAWGSFLGQLLLRSMDRSKEVYKSMQMRGFTGNFYYAYNRKMDFSDWMFIVVSILSVVILRFADVSLIGSLFI